MKSTASSSSSRRASTEQNPTAGPSSPVYGTPSSIPRGSVSSGALNISTGTPQSARQKELAEAEAKRRKIQRACDACRRKKIKCDGPMNSLSTSKCAHCQEYGLECTYLEAAKRRGPPKGYIETLEQRCGRLERILLQLHPSVDLEEYVGPPPDREDFDLASYQDSLRSLQIPPFPSLKPLPQSLTRSTSIDSAGPSPAAGLPSSSQSSLNLAARKPYTKDSQIEQENDTIHSHRVIEGGQTELIEPMHKMSVRDAQWRYHGKASGAHLMRTFQALKYEKHETGGDVRDFLHEVNRNKRAHFWQIPEWELVIANEGVRSLDYSIWPDQGLDLELIDAYFDHLNLHLPLLNRTLFKRQYEAELWKSNGWFAKVCLMIFANGSRFVDNDRVYWPRDLALTEEGQERLRMDRDGTLRYSAGWKYLHAVLRTGRSLMQGPNLYEFQCQVLVCAFLQGSAVPHVMWLISGVGLRSAQEIGIHIRSTLLNIDPIERALYNRAFWCLYHIDRVNCAGIGRSVALQDDDFDADYPIDVDDEYWDTGDPETDFQQPESAGISRISAFVHVLKLDHILGATLRTLYAINQAPDQRADLSTQRAFVMELDSALNSWADNVPDELRWDPTRTDYRLFQQSAALYVHYYYCQILIHRPFIQTPKVRGSPTPAASQQGPSLAICANASRSICNIVDVALRRGRQNSALPGTALHPSFMLPIWVAVIVLLINIYLGKQSPAERERAVLDVRRCLAASKEMELIWRQAGKVTDMLVELATEHDMPVATPPSQGEKRSHNADSPSTPETPSYQQLPRVNLPSKLKAGRGVAIGRDFDEERLVQATSAAYTAQAPSGSVDGPYGGYTSGLPVSNDRAQLPGQYAPAPLDQSRVESSYTAGQSSTQNTTGFDAFGYASSSGGLAAQGPFGAQEIAKQPMADGAFDANSFGNQLFDLGSSGFEVPGTGETDMWAQLFGDFTGQSFGGGGGEWAWNSIGSGLTPGLQYAPQFPQQQPPPPGSHMPQTDSQERLFQQQQQW
ncbi:hypothetical protein IAU60_002205 [Kwoniella sp. DSM 27419]